MTNVNQQVLFILTSQATMGNYPHATGFWFEELAAPWWVLKDAGYQTKIAAIGTTVSADPLSLDEAYRTSDVDRFLADPAALNALHTPLSLDALNVDDFAAIFLVGGHGTMWDFPQHQSLISVLMQAIRKNKIIAAVCHGVVGLCDLMDDNQRPFVYQRKLCGFSNEEEIAVGAHKAVPFLLEDRLRQLGALYQSAAAFQAKVVIDGQLITGKNPQSSSLLAQELLQLLRKMSTD